MLQVHQKYENLIAETFKNDPLFLSALDKACASVINSKLSEGIAGAICRSAELVRNLLSAFWEDNNCKIF